MIYLCKRITHLDCRSARNTNVSENHSDRDPRRLVKVAVLTAGLAAGGIVAAGAGGASASEETDDSERDGSDAGDDCLFDGAGLVTRESDGEFEATVAAIEDRIEESDLSLMTTVDHAANAESVDMELPPTTVLLFGNPKAGTQLMQGSPTVGIDLPQKMLVWSDEGTVNVTYNDPEYLAARHEIDDTEEVLEKAAETLQYIATGEESE